MAGLRRESRWDLSNMKQGQTRLRLQVNEIQDWRRTQLAKKLELDVTKVGHAVEIHSWCGVVGRRGVADEGEAHWLQVWRVRRFQAGGEYTLVLLWWPKHRQTRNIRTEKRPHTHMLCFHQHPCKAQKAFYTSRPKFQKVDCSDSPFTHVLITNNEPEGDLKKSEALWLQILMHHNVKSTDSVRSVIPPVPWPWCMLLHRCGSPVC